MGLVDLLDLLCDLLNLFLLTLLSFLYNFLLILYFKLFLWRKVKNGALRDVLISIAVVQDRDLFSHYVSDHTALFALKVY